MRTFFTFAYIVTSLVLSIPFGIIFLLLNLLGVARAFDWLLIGIVRLWASGVLLCTGSSVRVEGLDKVPRKGAVCFVGNHQGNVDILLLLSRLPRVAGFVTKKEAIFFPLINMWILAIGGLFLDRGSPRKAIESFKKGAAAIRAGRALIIFPEGTRSRGTAMGDFHPGSLKLALMADALVVPFTVNGSWQVWEEKKRIAPAKLSVVFHDPIDTATLDSEGKKALAERVRGVIAAGLPTT